ncbi:putative proteasome subunit alpha type [Cardiosporidium cionae]|uniref:Proteasome subunit alpha type n=1 Tax=Cardiosporidium cionae TaxID=476202 RepID=A0ABQ7JB07_9APIC|nr:putative proteasome subunit alpha type [Cardiosporidium cionae]|eukprot:KAF8821130.1 putative proteasome subunit alpha type [Cardiosporidium cionae]
MARRYDTRTTTFSPEGRLYQVEYALEAINKASSTIGIRTNEGIVLAADKMVTSKLLDQGNAKEKIYKIDDHILCAVAGLSADANILISHCRVVAQQYLYRYGELQPVLILVQHMCDTKQSYTQFGGLRPFGVSFLVAGYDKEAGFQLYNTDPSGNFSGWKATAIGVNNQSAQSILKQEWNEELNLDKALALAAKVLMKTMDTSSENADNLEFAVLTQDPSNPNQVKHVMLSDLEISQLMKVAREEQEKETRTS